MMEAARKATLAWPACHAITVSHPLFMISCWSVAYRNCLTCRIAQELCPTPWSKNGNPVILTTRQWHPVVSISCVTSRLFASHTLMPFQQVRLQQPEIQSRRRGSHTRVRLGTKKSVLYLLLAGNFSYLVHHFEIHTRMLQTTLPMLIISYKRSQQWTRNQSFARRC